jgi:hypothetical protein
LSLSVYGDPFIHPSKTAAEQKIEGRTNHDPATTEHIMVSDGAAVVVAAALVFRGETGASRRGKDDDSPS